MNAAGWVSDIPRPYHAAQLFGYCKARLQTVFMETCAEMRAAEPGALLSLEPPQALLHACGFSVKNGMFVTELLLNEFRRRFAFRVKADKEIGLGSQRL